MRSSNIDVNTGVAGAVGVGGGGGGNSKRFWVVVCRGNSETPTLNQTKFSCIFQPYTRLKTKTPHPIPDSIFSRNLVTITAQAKQNLLRVQNN